MTKTIQLMVGEVRRTKTFFTLPDSHLDIIKSVLWVGNTFINSCGRWRAQHLMLLLCVGVPRLSMSNTRFALNNARLQVKVRFNILKYYNKLQCRYTSLFYYFIYIYLFYYLFNYFFY